MKTVGTNGVSRCPRKNIQSSTEHTADHGERIGFPDWRIGKDGLCRKNSHRANAAAPERRAAAFLTSEFCFVPMIASVFIRFFHEIIEKRNALPQHRLFANHLVSPAQEKRFCGDGGMR